MRFLALLGAAVFSLAAALQYNDPDPLIWVLIYLVAATICVLAFADRVPAIVPLMVSSLYFVGCAFLATRVIGQQPWFDEMGREMFGLLMAGLWLDLTGVGLLVRHGKVV